MNKFPLGLTKEDFTFKFVNKCNDLFINNDMYDIMAINSWKAIVNVIDIYFNDIITIKKCIDFISFDNMLNIYFNKDFDNQLEFKDFINQIPKFSKENGLNQDMIVKENYRWNYLLLVNILEQFSEEEQRFLLKKEIGDLINVKSISNKHVVKI